MLKNLVRILVNCLLAGFVVLLMVESRLILYLLSQGKGQFTIIYQSRPIPEVLEDSAFPDSLKTKLLLIGEIKNFATDSLGLNPTKNYTSLYDQHGKSLLLVVTASEAYSFTPKEWHFPVLGKVPYKGYFNKPGAVLEAVKLRELGYDVDLGRVSGWSTLGFFNDPVLSSMLGNTSGNLANVIIHELSHSTVYVKNKTELNENLASFIGNKGAEKFLLAKFGKESKEMREYFYDREDEQFFNRYVLGSKTKLDSLYKNKPADTELLKKAKMRLIMQCVYGIKNTAIHDKARYGRAIKRAIYSGNAYFMSFQRYDSGQEEFEKELQDKFKGDLRAFIRSYKEKYPFL